MKKTTFGSFKSTNNKFHNKVALDDEYSGYLKRI
jgi:hypothetical protein